MSAAAAAAPADAEPEPRIGRLILLAAVVGLVAAGGAVLFVTAEHWVEHFLWEVVPEQLGWQEPAGWWVIAVLLLGALLVYAAMQLPGEAGHRPLDGFTLDINSRAMIGSVLLAALGSLAFGAVLGPEAPLLAIGTTVGLFLARRSMSAEVHILVAAGAMAAIGNIFGNPMVTAILVLEYFVLRGGVGGKNAVTELLPVMTALGFGYLLQVGVTRNWEGFGESVLAVPGLPDYSSVLIADLVIAVVLAAVVAAFTTAAFRIGSGYQKIALLRPLPALLGAAGILGVTAIVVRAITDLPVESVLFSGQSAIGDTLLVGSAGTLLLVALAKVLVFGVSLGSGFRGGAVFPAVFIGVTLGTLTSVILDNASLSAYVAAGIAAGGAASMRLPFTSVLLAVLLCSESGYAITSVAIPAAAVGLLVRAMIDAAIERKSVAEVENVGDPVEGKRD
jgi:H+/Cl- antiporter ClcA